MLGFPEYCEPARRLAEAAGLAFEQIGLHIFPDGESRVRLPARLPERVIICRSLDHPNAKLVELALAAVTARELGASHLVLVAPYLCYMRQDKAFRPGEAVSQPIIGSLLARWFDEVVTVDPHLHRVHDLGQAVPAKRATVLTAAGAMSGFLAETCKDAFLIGPDEESEQWVSSVAREGGLDYAVGRKRRLGDSRVEIILPEREYRGRQMVLLDDVASTGRTLEVTAGALSSHKPASISVLVTHALFVKDALQRLNKAGVGRIWSTDSIPHATNVIHLAGLISTAL